MTYFVHDFVECVFSLIENTLFAIFFRAIRNIQTKIKTRLPGCTRNTAHRHFPTEAVHSLPTTKVWLVHGSNRSGVTAVPEQTLQCTLSQRPRCGSCMGAIVQETLQCLSQHCSAWANTAVHSLLTTKVWLVGAIVQETLQCLSQHYSAWANSAVPGSTLQCVRKHCTGWANTAVSGPTLHCLGRHCSAWGQCCKTRNFCLFY